MRYVLAACLLCSIPTAQAGTITGSEGGTATIEITQYVKGVQGAQTFYGDIAAQLTYTVFPPTVVVFQGIPVDIHPEGSFQFSLVTDPITMNTSSSLFTGYYFEGPNSTLFPGFTTWSLQSDVYHVYELRADMVLASADNSLIGAYYYLNLYDDFGNGEVVSATFTPNGDPPSSLPEPSSALMMAIGILAIFRRMKCVRSKIK